MLDNLKKIGIFAISMPFIPKVILSLCIILIAALFLALLWMPQNPSPDELVKDGKNYNTDFKTLIPSELQ